MINVLTVVLATVGFFTVVVGAICVVRKVVMLYEDIAEVKRMQKHCNQSYDHLRDDHWKMDRRQHEITGRVFNLETAAKAKAGDPFPLSS